MKEQNKNISDHLFQVLHTPIVLYVPALAFSQGKENYSLFSDQNTGMITDKCEQGWKAAIYSRIHKFPHARAQSELSQMLQMNFMHALTSPCVIRLFISFL
jgi:hypothetical protein